MIRLSDPDVTLHAGDVLDVLRTMPDESVDCVITSPPYWGHRDYGTGDWEGGDPDCAHVRPIASYNKGFNERWGTGPGKRKQERKSEAQYAQRCKACGARRVDRQLGLEETTEEYVAALVEVFAEIRRVLAGRGTCWLNLGDTYVKKQLLMVPARTALALQADGWILRADVIWSKLNATPEPVRDRPTKAHEYLFLLVKKRRYFYDRAAVREPAEWLRWGDQTNHKHQGNSRSAGSWITDRPKSDFVERKQRNIRSVWPIPTQPFPEAHFAVFPEELVRRCLLAGCPPGGTVLDPFVGTGTTCVVARKHGRRAVGIDLNAGYLDLACRRLQQLSLPVTT